jgi:hypothetical protein
MGEQGVNKRKERLNELRYNNKKELMKIIEYNNSNDIIVEFQDEYKGIKHTNYSSFKKGEVSNPYGKTIFDIGYFGVGKYNKKDYPKIYNTWRHMLERCYDPYFINYKRITYKDCIVCEEWHNFQNFAKWYEENYYECNNEKMHLDKDILYKGNKIYSPDYCIFVPMRINCLFTKTNVNRGKYPIGVYYKFKKVDKYEYHYLEVSCSILENGIKKSKVLKTLPLDKPFQAFTVYKQFKENYIKQVANEYKNLIPKKLYDALYDYKVEIND